MGIDRRLIMKLDRRQYAINFAYRNVKVPVKNDSNNWDCGHNQPDSLIFGDDPDTILSDKAHFYTNPVEAKAMRLYRYNWMAVAVLIYSNLQMRMFFWEDNFTPHRRTKMPLEKVFDEAIKKHIEPRLEYIDEYGDIGEGLHLYKHNCSDYWINKRDKGA